MRCWVRLFWLGGALRCLVWAAVSRPCALWRGSLISVLTWHASVRYDYSCKRGKPMKKDGTRGVKSGDAQQRASDSGCESQCRGGTAGSASFDTRSESWYDNRMTKYGV